MFPIDIISHITNYLPYSDYLNLTSTCSSYHNNAHISLIRMNEKILSHEDPFQLLLLSISINDIKMINTIIKLAIDKIPSSKFTNDTILKLLAKKSTRETFQIIIKIFSLDLYVPDSFKNRIMLTVIQEDFCYMFDIIYHDRDDMMLYFLELHKNELHTYNCIFSILRKSIELSSTKIVTLILRLQYINQYSIEIEALFTNLLNRTNVNIDILEIFIKNYKDNRKFLPQILLYNNSKLSKIIFDEFGY